VVFSRVQHEKDRIEGVVDAGLMVISHSENPAKNHALEFLKDVLLWKKRCLIPVTAFSGAYHILTNYLGVERVSAYEALKKTLETKSPAFYTDMNVDLAIEALTNAMGYRIESWDGYVAAIARSHSAPIIYTVDGKMKKKVKGLHVINPIPEDVFREYSEWLEKNLAMIATLKNPKNIEIIRAPANSPLSQPLQHLLFLKSQPNEDCDKKYVSVDELCNRSPRKPMYSVHKEPAFP